MRWYVLHGFRYCRHGFRLIKTVKAVLFVQFAGLVNIHNDNVKNRKLNLLLQTVTVHRYKPSTQYIRQP